MQVICIVVCLCVGVTLIRCETTNTDPSPMVQELALSDRCAAAVDQPKLFEETDGLLEACEEQMQIIDHQEALEEIMKQPGDKRKNEFIRFGKRKNEFIRFGRSGPVEEQGNMPMKRKNEFIRFGKRKNEFIRFGKRKNEFIRFGRNAPDSEDMQHEQQKRKNEFIRFGRSGAAPMEHEQQKRKNEFIRFGKRKNEFIRFG
jgi:hypothetical protein